jgi:hypothetical protein
MTGVPNTHGCLDVAALEIRPESPYSQPGEPLVYTHTRGFHSLRRKGKWLNLSIEEISPLKINI